MLHQNVSVDISNFSNEIKIASLNVTKKHAMKMNTY